MITQGIVNIIASIRPPYHRFNTLWSDLSSGQDGSILKVWKDNEWKAITGGDVSLSHDSLSNRNLHDQHPVSAITGLVDIFNGIEQSIGYLTSNYEFLQSSKQDKSPNNGKLYGLFNGGLLEIIEFNIPASKVVYVNALSTKSIEDGTIQNPFKTVQAAINFALSGTVIYLFPAFYAENITINGKYNIILDAYGTDLTYVTSINSVIVENSNRIVINGLSINSTIYISGSTSIEVSNFSCGDLQSLSYASNEVYTNGFINGTMLLAGSHSTYRIIGCSLSDAGIINMQSPGFMTDSTAFISKCFNVEVTHNSGYLYLEGITKFKNIVTGYAVNSIADTGILSFDNCSLCRHDIPQRVLSINKTGSVDIILGDLVHKHESNIISGQLVDDMGISTVQVLDANFRTGYSSPSKPIKYHLDAISRRFNEMQEAIDLIAGTSTQVPVRTSGTNMPILMAGTTGSLLIGEWANLNSSGDYSSAVGYNASIDDSSNAIALGAYASCISAYNSAAIGAYSTAIEPNVVSFGDSNSGTSRRLIQVSDGINSKDATTVGQVNGLIAKSVAILPSVTLYVTGSSNLNTVEPTSNISIPITLSGSSPSSVTLSYSLTQNITISQLSSYVIGMYLNSLQNTQYSISVAYSINSTPIASGIIPYQTSISTSYVVVPLNNRLLNSPIQGNSGDTLNVVVTMSKTSGGTDVVNITSTPSQPSVFIRNSESLDSSLISDNDGISIRSQRDINSVALSSIQGALSGSTMVPVINNILQLPTTSAVESDRLTVIKGASPPDTPRYLSAFFEYVPPFYTRLKSVEDDGLTLVDNVHVKDSDTVGGIDINNILHSRGTISFTSDISNLDNALGLGSYTYTSTADGNPSPGNDGNIIVFGKDSTTLSQLAVNRVEGVAYIRSRLDSLWGNWNEIWTTGNMPNPAVSSYGTWVPTISGTTVISSTCRYIKMGNIVSVSGSITFNVTPSTSDIVLGSLPFSASSQAQPYLGSYSLSLSGSASVNLSTFVAPKSDIFGRYVFLTHGNDDPLDGSSITSWMNSSTVTVTVHLHNIQYYI